MPKRQSTKSRNKFFWWQRMKNKQKNMVKTGVLKSKIKMTNGLEHSKVHEGDSVDFMISPGSSSQKEDSIDFMISPRNIAQKENSADFMISPGASSQEEDSCDILRELALESLEKNRAKKTRVTTTSTLTTEPCEKDTDQISNHSEQDIISLFDEEESLLL